jgi:hypothetical protein
VPRRKLAPQPEPGEPGTVRARRSGDGGQVYWHPIDAAGQESPAGYADRTVAERKAREAVEADRALREIRGD